MGCKGEIERIKAENRLDPNLMDSASLSRLPIAARIGDIGFVKQMLAYGLDVTQKIYSGKTLLGWACSSQRDNYDMIELLIEAGADGAETDENGTSLLCTMLQASSFNDHNVQALLDGGADPGLMTGGHRAPIHLAVVSGCRKKWKSLNLLLIGGVDVNLRAPDGKTALHFAVLMKDVKSVRMLLRAGGEPNTQDSDLMSPLMECINHSREMTEIMRLLLTAGARLLSGERAKNLVLRQFKSEQEREELKERLLTPMTLAEIARRGLCQRFGPNTYFWLRVEGPKKLPVELLPFAKFDV